MLIQLTNADRPASENEAHLRRVLVNPEHIVSVVPMSAGRTRIQTTATHTGAYGGHLLVTETYDEVFSYLARWQEDRR